MVCIPCGYEIEGDDIDQPCPQCRRYHTLMDENAKEYRSNPLDESDVIPEVLTCQDCGFTGEGVVRGLRYVGGQGCVRHAHCINEDDCWSREKELK